MMWRRRASHWAPAEAAASLARLAYVERAIANILAGWAVKMPSFEAKLAFGLQMHRSMERAAALRSRVNGLCHAVGDEATVAAGWQALAVHIDRAKSPERLLAAIYGWLCPKLIALYEAHLAHTDPLGDRASVELVASFLPSLKSERREGLALPPRSRRADSRAWFADLDAKWDGRMDEESVGLADPLWAPVDRVPAAVRPRGLQSPTPGSLGVLPVDPLGDPRDVGMFLHKELDEEYTTLELLARNSYEHPDMPFAFHRDMARQVSDEARHAMIILRLMAARGFRHGDFPVSTSSYDGLYEFAPCEPGSRQELAWRILIRQTFEEGLAIDNLGYEIGRRRAAGQGDIATALEYILRDEVFHAASGLRWSRELLGPDAVREERGRAVDYLRRRAESEREAFVMNNLDEAMSELAVIQDGREQRGGKLPERPLNRTGRARAGYSDEDIGQVVAWGFATDEAGTS